jgi:predicted CXXCH cytochrome family protein
MKGSAALRSLRPWHAFAVVFFASLAVGVVLGLPPQPAQAQTPEPTPTAGPATRYNGPDYCANCHTDIHDQWQSTRHALAFSSPVFQQDWQALGSEFTCLACHTTGYDPASISYATEGVTCEACHGPFQIGHPDRPMPITPDSSLCSTCHKTTSDEWLASRHGAVGVSCQSCHNPHSTAPRAETITALCTNCHKDRGDTFAHSTHANAGLECSNCHMYTAPRTGSPVGGLVPTGHTFLVGSETCINCHQDTVHSRDTILSLTGQLEQAQTTDPEALQQQLQNQEETITALEASNSTRLYTGLAQGAIIGLVTGGTAAWIVSRRLRVVVEEIEDEKGEGDDKPEAEDEPEE